MVIGLDSIFGSKNIISETSELSSFGISAKTKKRCFWMFSQSTVLGTTSYSEIVFFDDFSVVTARDDFILGQVATSRLSRLYLS